MKPSNLLGRSGVERVTVPIREASGQAIGSFVPRPICAGEQALSPAEAAGERVMPSGRATTTRLAGGAPSALGLSFRGNPRGTARPAGGSALLTAGATCHS